MKPPDSADLNYFNWDEPMRDRGEGCSFSLLYIHFTHTLGKCDFYLVHLQLFMDTRKRNLDLLHIQNQPYRKLCLIYMLL